MDKRFAIALACSLALHVFFLSALRVGGSLEQRGDLKTPLLVYLPSDAATPTLRNADHPIAPSNNPALLPEIATEERRYLLSSEVDVRAMPVNMPVLIYPEKAQQMRIDGLVRMKVYIGANGRIDSVDIVETRPPGVFEEAALKALLATSFTPATKNGRNVKSQKLIEIKFDPYEAISQP